MKKFTALKIAMLSIGLALISNVCAQYSPTASLQITVSENNAVTVNNYQVLLTLNTQAMVLAGTLQADGRDIRFGSNGCLTDTLPHWVESGMNTPTTKIWVKISTIPASSSVDIYLFGGDPLAVDASNFNAVFPNAIITAGANVTVTGANEIGWLQVDVNDTLFVTAGTLAELSARKTVIDGVIMANGAGYAGGVIGPNTGTGPGAGSGSTNSGCGGGSYGNLGGTGGYDGGDTPGVGGPIYGTDTGLDIDAGSGGGSSDNSFGGNGGGGVRVISEDISLGGIIAVNGFDGQQPGGSRGGGGGSGGGVLLFAENVNFSGSISANGGAGSVGLSTANDDGGGGAGGRIKILYGNAFVPGGITSVNGGVGGPNGSASGGINGLPGVVYSGVQAFNPITYTLGSVGVPQTFSATISDPDTSFCMNESITFTANGAGPFDFLINAVSVQSGAASTYVTTGLSDGDIVTVSSNGCEVIFDVTVFALPTTSITPSILGPVCFGNTVVLYADPGYSNYLWNDASTVDSLAVINDGTYDVIVTDANGCSGSANFSMTYAGTPPVISGNLIACEGDTVDLSINATNMVSYLWSTGETINPIEVTSTQTVSIATLDNDGCSGADSVDVIFDVNPTPTISEAGGILNAGAGYSTYQWQLNGTDILGATSQTYTMTNGGNYTVVVTNSSGCEGLSAVFSSTIGISESSNSSMHVYPNPFTSELIVQVHTLVSDEVAVTVLNQQGQEVYTEKFKLISGNNEATLQLEEFASGIYFIRIAGAITNLVQKVVKN